MGQGLMAWKFEVVQRPIVSSNGLIKYLSADETIAIECYRVVSYRKVYKDDLYTTR